MRYLAKKKKLEKTKGVIHDYLWFTIDFLLPGKVVFSIFNYLEDIIVKEPLYLKIRPKNTIPESGKLFTVNENLPLLCKEKAESFRWMVARLVFSLKQAWPYIQVAVSFICMRVKNPTKKDYDKPGQLIRYVGETIHVNLIIGAEDSNTLVWNADES